MRWVWTLPFLQPPPPLPILSGVAKFYENPSKYDIGCTDTSVIFQTMGTYSKEQCCENCKSSTGVGVAQNPFANSVFATNQLCDFKQIT